MQVKQAIAGVLAVVGLVGVGFWAGGAAASSNEPGSAADPLVSKSYVEDLASDLESRLQSRLAGLADKEYVDERILLMGQNQSDGVDKAYVDSKLAFQVVNLSAGSRIIGEAGTELVLRGGKAIAIAGPLGGLLDATGGTDVPQGESVKPNHLLAVPRADGRGLYATQDAVLMVKGNYTIQAPGQ